MSTEKEIFEYWLHSRTITEFDRVLYADDAWEIWQAATKMERQRCFTIAKNSGPHAEDIADRIMEPGGVKNVSH